MRRPHRDIEIFSMSVLDMFASALGAFIIVVIILFPYYNDAKLLKYRSDEINRIESQLTAASELTLRKDAELKRVTSEAEQLRYSERFYSDCEQAQNQCKMALTKTFLVIAIEWDEQCDVDLYVKDPAGRQFSYSSPSFAPNSEAELSLDMRRGPGLEIWQEPSALTGSYEIVYEVSALKFPSVKVRGWVLDRSGGKRALPIIVLTSGKNRTQVASVRVAGDGSAVIQDLSL